MDRCHRIGQQKPVLVLRLATAHRWGMGGVTGFVVALCLERAALLLHNPSLTNPARTGPPLTLRSVEGRMLRRAGEKLMLERLVIKKGAFIDVTQDVSAPCVSRSCTHTRASCAPTHTRAPRTPRHLHTPTHPCTCAEHQGLVLAQG